MIQHTDLIERLIGLAETAHSYYEGSSFDAVAKAAFKDALSAALEAQAREIAELKAQLAATAKNAFEAMPHDIPRRMKDSICEETGWSGSMVSRMYTELRKAFTGEPYKANEDLDAALLEIAELKAQEAELCTLYGLAQAECQKLRKDAERYRWIKERKSIDLRSDCSTWVREDGKRFIASHFLAAGNTQFAAFESLDETIDAAMKGQP